MSRRTIKPFAVEFRRSRAKPTFATPTFDDFPLHDPALEEFPVRHVSEDVPPDDVRVAAERLFSTRTPAHEPAPAEVMEEAPDPAPRILPNLLQDEVDPVALLLRERQEEKAERMRRARAARKTVTETVVADLFDEPAHLVTAEVSRLEGVEDIIRAALHPAEATATALVTKPARKGPRRGKKEFGPGERWKARRLKFLR